MNSQKSVLSFFIATVLGTSAFSQAVFSQPAGRPPIAGGFRAVSIKDGDALRATEYAIKTQKQKGPMTLVAIERAERQVVAGMNYRITLKVKTGPKIQRVQTVIYQDLQGQYSLTSWQTIMPSKPAKPKAAKLPK